MEWGTSLCPLPQNEQQQVHSFSSGLSARVLQRHSLPGSAFPLTQSQLAHRVGSTFISKHSAGMGGRRPKTTVSSGRFAGRMCEIARTALISASREPGVPCTAREQEHWVRVCCASPFYRPGTMAEQSQVDCNGANENPSIKCCCLLYHRLAA